MTDHRKMVKLSDKEYRDAYLEAQVRLGIAYQIQALRTKFGESQTEFAERVGKTQSVISRLEGDNGRASVPTLIEIAQCLDIALLVRFVDYREFLDRTEDKSELALQPESFAESMAAPHSAKSKYGAQWSSPARQSEPSSAYSAMSDESFRHVGTSSDSYSALLQLRPAVEAKIDGRPRWNQ